MDDSIATLRRQQKVLAELKRRQALLYRPYPKQAEFHRLGKTRKVRLFLAGNQLGKTLGGGYEKRCHLTGLYPDWWEGYRFDRPIVAWLAGTSATHTRDNAQRMLLGRAPDWGSGMIEGKYIDSIVKARGGVADLIDYAKIKHVSGGLSTIATRNYEQDVDKWSGETLDILWCDEEPPYKHYDEGLTRLQNGGNFNPETGTNDGGLMFITATPLLGMTEVIDLFWPEPTDPNLAMVRMEIEDVDHYTDEQKEAYIARYPKHTRQARARGIPVLGSGAVYPVAQESIEIDFNFEVPSSWKLINGLDFGWDHPTAAARCAWDADSDTFYVLDVYAEEQQVVAVHASAFRAWGLTIPWAWPHDGAKHDHAGGIALKDHYANEGLLMLHEHATLPSGSVSLEASCQEMLNYMMAGRFKVAKHLERFWAEFTVYHRKDGRIEQRRDDVLDAVRYAFMMRRFARPAKVPKHPRRLLPYDPLAEPHATEIDKFWWPEQEGYKH